MDKKHRKTLFYFYFVLLIYAMICVPDKSDAAVLSGKITDQSNGLPVNAVIIWLEGTAFSTVTDANGDYLIDNIPDGHYTIIIDAPKYRQKVYRELGLGIYDDIDASDKPDLPDHFQVDQNYPNPFNPSTTITYFLPQAARVAFSIYDDLGRLVYNPAGQWQAAGFHSLKWSAVTTDKVKLPSGIYFYRVQAGNWQETRKMLLIQ